MIDRTAHVKEALLAVLKPVSLLNQHRPDYLAEVCVAQRPASRRSLWRQHRPPPPLLASLLSAQAETLHQTQHYRHIKPLNSMPQCRRGSPACHQPSICAPARRRALPCRPSRRTASGGLPLATTLCAGCNRHPTRLGSDAVSRRGRRAAAPCSFPPAPVHGTCSVYNGAAALPEPHNPLDPIRSTLATALLTLRSRRPHRRPTGERRCRGWGGPCLRWGSWRALPDRVCMHTRQCICFMQRMHLPSPCLTAHHPLVASCRRHPPWHTHPPQHAPSRTARPAAGTGSPAGSHRLCGYLRVLQWQHTPVLLHRLPHLPHLHVVGQQHPRFSQALRHHCPLRRPADPRWRDLQPQGVRSCCS